MSDADVIARKLDFMRADIEEPGSSPAARLIAGHAALLLGAVDAVLRQHPPIDSDGTMVCDKCSFAFRTPWPCGEVEAITTALTGKDAGNG